MTEHDDEPWYEGAVLTKISPRDVAETVVYAVLWPPTVLMMRAGNWIVERFR